MDHATKVKPTIRACLAGAYLFTVAAFGYSDTMGLLFVPQLVGAGLVAYALLDILMSFRLTIPREIRLYGLLGFYAVVTFFRPGPGAADTTSLVTLVKVVVTTIACGQLIKDDYDLHTVLRIFTFSALLVYFQNRTDLKYLSIADKFAESDRFAGTLTNANVAAMFALTIIWASLFLLIRSRGRLVDWGLALVPTGLSLVILYFSGSKKGMIGLAILVLFGTRLFYMKQKSSLVKKGIILLASTALILIAGYFIYSSPFFSRIQDLLSGASGSDSNRLILAAEALNVWLADWKTFFIGVGYDNFRIHGSLGSYAHSTPLELLASNGLIGFLLFAGFLFLLFRRFYLLFRFTTDQELKKTFFAILLFLSIFFVFSLASVLQGSRELMPIMACLAAFGQSCVRVVPARGQSCQGEQIQAC